ncbi:hypothetical protein [Moraxella lacunata]
MGRFMLVLYDLMASSKDLSSMVCTYKLPMNMFKLPSIIRAI